MADDDRTRLDTLVDWLLGQWEKVDDVENDSAIAAGLIDDAERELEDLRMALGDLPARPGGSAGPLDSVLAPENPEVSAAVTPPPLPVRAVAAE